MSPARMRAVVVDDEPLARRGIRARLARAPDVDVVAECATGAEAVAAIRSLAPDLVFLDVQMPELDGFGVVEAVGAEEMPFVVFVTAHDTHAVRAFDLHALDYVLKPIDDDRFDRAVGRARGAIAARRDGAMGRRLAALLGDLRQDAAPNRAGDGTAEPTRFLVRDRGRIVVLGVEEIDWVQAEGDYVRVHAGGRGYLVRETMAAAEARLDPSRFARIHRSAIVSVARVRELRPLPNREYVVVLRDGTQLRLSRSYRDRVAGLFGEPL